MEGLIEYFEGMLHTVCILVVKTFSKAAAERLQLIKGFA